MSEISRTALFGKLNPLAYKAIEGATVFCKMRGNPYVELVHWLAQLVQNNETDLDAIITHVSAVQPRLLIIDSVQTIAAGDVDGVPGGVTQVREVAAALTAVAKERAMSTILVGHVTKDGSTAGSRSPAGKGMDVNQVEDVRQALKAAFRA